MRRILVIPPGDVTCVPIFVETWIRPSEAEASVNSAGPVGPQQETAVSGARVRVVCSDSVVPFLVPPRYFRAIRISLNTTSG